MRENYFNVETKGRNNFKVNLLRTETPQVLPDEQRIEYSLLKENSVPRQIRLGFFEFELLSRLPVFFFS